jgi:hypothetical protein|tara:strand:- start:1173 stop:1361 length:189 start_codon:yes stop_codon:yes gene_type:complete
VAPATHKLGFKPILGDNKNSDLPAVVLDSQPMGSACIAIKKPMTDLVLDILVPILLQTCAVF